VILEILVKLKFLAETRPERSLFARVLKGVRAAVRRCGSLKRKFLMKIAQIAPLAESCPPKLYGGSERIVSYLTEELVELGHDVTLFATGDSKTSGARTL